MKPTAGRIIHYYASNPDRELTEPVVGILTYAHREPPSFSCAVNLPEAGHDGDEQAEENEYNVRFKLFPSEFSFVNDTRDHAWFSQKPRAGYWTWPSRD